jgi:hypothetical protein
VHLRGLELIVRQIALQHAHANTPVGLAVRHFFARASQLQLNYSMRAVDFLLMPFLPKYAFIWMDTNFPSFFLNLYELQILGS